MPYKKQLKLIDKTLEANSNITESNKNVGVHTSEIAANASKIQQVVENIREDSRTDQLTST